MIHSQFYEIESITYFSKIPFNFFSIKSGIYQIDNFFKSSIKNFYSTDKIFIITKNRINLYYFKLHTFKFIIKLEIF